MASNNPVSNLPEFREEASFPQPNVAGSWVSAGGTLRQLGESLQVDETLPESTQASVIRAIPDPWAQARTFAEAVLDERHSMHAGALAQWRGLLALFALADIRKADYSIDIQPVSLEGDHPFDRVLRHLPPRVSVGDNAELWLQPHIVYVHPKRGKVRPVGILNPLSLIAPGRTGWSISFDFIPWMRKGIRDPLKLSESALSETQLAILAAYLTNLRDAIPFRGDAKGIQVRQMLNEFLDDVEEARNNRTITANVRRAADSHLPPLYQQLALPGELEEPDDAAGVSECRLRLAEMPATTSLGGLVLIDESVAASLKRSPRDVIAWGNHTLGELLDSPNTLQTVQREAADRGYWLITADDLFTDRLIRLRKEPRIPGHKPDMRDVLEPIRPLVLLLDQSTTRGIELDASPTQAKFTLHMRLDVGGAGGVQHSVTRIFRKDSATAPRLVDDVDWDFGQASVWPDFKASHWPYYFARLRYPTTREQARPQFAISKDIIVAALAKAATDHEGSAAQHALQALQAINLGGAPGEQDEFFRRFQSVSGKAYEEVQISNTAFDAVFYVDYHPDRDAGAAGCVRLKLTELGPSDTSVAVAIDFGSTNSVACFEGSDGKPVILKSRVVHPIMFQDAARNEEWRHIARWQFVEFLPLTDRETPTPTVVIGRNDADRNADLWLCRNLIFFQPTIGHARKGAEQEIEQIDSYLRRSQFDLKWNEDPRHIDAAADYLDQFMTMVAAEAVAKAYDPRQISWHFSVPDAMQGSRLASFRAQVVSAQGKLSPGSETQDLYSEGLAAARYILSGQKGGKFTQGSINAILDIGGSTTDITLWARDVLLWKGSFRLAGRAFFTDTIVHNPEILREVELGDWADLIDPSKPNPVPPENLAYVGELLFSRPALSEAFDKHWNRRLNVKPGEVLRGTALIYLAGIAHYIGLVVKGLLAEKTIVEADLARPAFALCGRGAGIFSRIHDSSSADRESPVTLALKSFSRAAEIEKLPRPQLFVSKRPKLEVAAGMMVDFAAIDARAGEGKAKSAFTPIGLQIEFASGTTLEADAPIGTPVNAQGARGSDLGELEDFLDGLEEFTGIDVDLCQGIGQGAFNEINTVVRQEVDRQKNEEGATVIQEPPFIAALRALVSIMAAPEKERKKRLKFEFEA